jgi:hypothetical protein
MLIFFSINSRGSFKSTTRIIRSEYIVSSSVEWKASISEIGKRSIKPTVSVNRNLRLENSVVRVVVESVVNNDGSTLTSDSVRALKRVL